jgi:hypothetical protein
MDREVRREREGVRNRDLSVLEAGGSPLDDAELANGAPFVVAEECDDGCAEAGAKRGGDLGRVSADEGDVAVVDLEFGLERCEVPDLARALRSPVAAVKAHDEGKPLRKLREPDEGARVIRQLQIGELSAVDEIGSHGFLLGQHWMGLAGLQPTTTLVWGWWSTAERYGCLIGGSAVLTIHSSCLISQRGRSHDLALGTLTA